ncbi:membrane protein [Candidatus Magnetobacterium bavaricum]|uniref:Membrane protein n=1 Tax=Candidatus Magnetobacterium bavaricum TaxID=29290 RepID=A0A0F3GI10_9BACT|nr:membrane protein [Candidatus Magnetobacterium bavaricum]
MTGGCQMSMNWRALLILICLLHYFHQAIPLTMFRLYITGHLLPLLKFLLMRGLSIWATMWAMPMCTASLNPPSTLPGRFVPESPAHMVIRLCGPPDRPPLMQQVTTVRYKKVWFGQTHVLQTMVTKRLLIT